MTQPLSRRALLGAAAASGLTTAAGPARRPAPQPKRPLRTLIRGARILTMDDRLGSIDPGDVLIEGRRIASVGPRLAGVDAEVITADGMVLTPGMVDAHRHVWQQLVAGLPSDNYFEDVHMRLAVAFEPEDVYFGQYFGGLTAIESGVTRVADHSHIAHTPEKGDAAARGLRDSGIAGVFCYQISATPTYRPGMSVSRAQAYAELFGPYDAWHVRQAEQLRDRYFSDRDAPLQFGLALSPTEIGVHSVASMREEIQVGRRLGAKVITHHLYGLPCRESADGRATYRAVPKLYEAGLIGPEYLASHGNQFTNEELEMIARAGGALVGASGDDGVDTRARSFGIRTAIGVDSPVGAPTDYLYHVRTAMTLGRRAGPRDRSGPDQPLPPLSVSQYAAFHTATVGGAAAIGQGATAGSLSLGKDADLVLWRADRLGVPRLKDLARQVVGYGSGGDIDSVWVAGVAKKRGGRMVGIDWAALKARAARDSDRLAAAAASVNLTGSPVRIMG